MTDSSSELEKGTVSSDTLPVPKSDDQADKSDTYSYLAHEHTDQGEHIGEENNYPVQDSIQKHLTPGVGGSEFVIPQDTLTDGHHSEPTSYTQQDFEITADWLSEAIKNPYITVKAAPILLCITGLPNSNVSTVTDSLLYQLNCGTFPFKESTEQGIYFYETSTVRIPGDPAKVLAYSKEFHYLSVIESAIKNHLQLQGKFPRNIQVPIFKPNVFNEEELDNHLKSMMDEFYQNGKKQTDNPIWNQGLPSGIALINMWEIGHSKAAAYILPLLSGYLDNSYIWMLFDIIRDLPSLYEPPAKNEINGRMESQSHLHYLLHFAKLAASQKDSKRTKVCKLISYHKGVETVDKQQEEKAKQFQMDAFYLATQMGVNELIDIDSIHLFNSDQKNIKIIKKTLDDIVHKSLDKPVEIPLTYIFLRSLYYNNKSLLYISKRDLQIKAKYLKLNDDDKFDLHEFCLLFTSFGSIIDVSLIDPSSDILILQPVKFFHEVDKLFHPNADIYPLLSKYGIVTEEIASSIFRNLANVIMESLVSFGIAAKLSSSQVNYTLPAPNGVVYYIPYASKSPHDYNCQPTALHLLCDVNRPMSHSKVAFVSKFLNHCNSTMLELPDEPVGNITKFKVTSSNGSKVVFEFAYLPDAFEFRFQPPYNQKHEEIQEISKNIIVVCNDIMQIDTKYNFAVMCSADMDSKLTTQLKRKRHLLPNRMICPECKSKGLHNYDLIQIWNQLLINEEKCKVPETKKLNGEPLTADDACSVVKGLEKLSDDTLHVVARYLDMPDFLTSAKRRMWRKCMTMILDWEDKSLLSEDEELKREASKKGLAIKLMHAANELYTVNKEESRALENVAKSLNFKVASGMLLHKYTPVITTAASEDKRLRRYHHGEQKTDSYIAKLNTELVTKEEALTELRQREQQKDSYIATLTKFTRKSYDVRQQNQQQHAFRKTRDFLCKLEVVLQPVQDDWEQLSLQLNIDQFTLTDIKNKEDSSEQMRSLLEWVVKKGTLTQLEDALRNLGKTAVISGLHDLQIQICTQSDVIEQTCDPIDDKSSHYDDETTIHLSSKKDQVQVSTESINKCIHCDYWNSPNISDSFEGMMLVGRKICIYSATTDHELIVEECGLKVIFPAEVIMPVESEYEVAVQGLWGGNFEFPECSKLISGVCYISVSSSSQLNKPVTIELEHCAYIVNERQTKYLRFVVAKSGPPFKFKFLRGGSFSSKSRIGRISLQTFSALAIVNIMDCFKASNIVGCIIGSMVGGVSGASVGIPTAGALIGGTIGYKVGQSFKTKDPDCMYQGHIFRKSTGPKEWDVKFAVTQDTNYSKNILEEMFGAKLDHFGFRFKSQSLQLKGFPENFRVQGWTIKARSSPPVINMEEVDKFSSSRIAEPPCISIRIHAVTDAHDFIKDLEYSLNVDGIQRVFDEKLLQDSTQPQIDITISLDDHIHSNMSLDQLLDQQPTIQEVTTYARTAEWNKLGVQLGLDNVPLAGCFNYTSMYQLWIEQNGAAATRRSLLDALRAIRQNKVADDYEHYLETTIHTSMS